MSAPIVGEAIFRGSIAATTAVTRQQPSHESVYLWLGIGAAVIGAVIVCGVVCFCKWATQEYEPETPPDVDVL